VTCNSQQEIDELWSKLTAGGQESRCDWLKDPAKSARVMQAMLQRKKMDLAPLERAHRGQ
jgi:predicted 3-demethylubiquinone-9 3-methyltransferase (glyoxalase superfamily)